MIRLWLPCIFMQFVAIMSMRLGLGSWKFEDQGSHFAQVGDWLWHLNRMANLFSYRSNWEDLVDVYQGEVWTIPLEVYGSFVCYLAVLAVARMPRMHTRMLVMCALQLLAFLNNG